MTFSVIYKSLHIESGPEVLENFKVQLSILKKHCFLSSNQHKYYKAAKKTSLLMKV